MGARVSLNQDKLSVFCSILSPKNPTSTGWDFGDGQNSNNLTSVTHEYSEMGFYIITLTVDGDTERIPVGVSPYGDCLTKSIYDIFDSKLPSGITVSDDEKTNAIQKWQTNLYPYINNSGGIYNELAFPSLVNLLIIDLALFTILNDYTSKYLINAASPASKEIRSMESGPTKAEWYSNSELMKNLSGKGGFLDLLKGSICLQARESNIPIYLCDKNTVTIIPKTLKPRR